jgi:CRISPR-associated protein Cas2
LGKGEDLTANGNGPSRTLELALLFNYHSLRGGFCMFVVVSYDIPDDGRRTRLFTLLKGYGRHIQYSVFECELRRQRFTEMVTRIRFLVDRNADHVRFYRLCAKDVRNIYRIGGLAPVKEKPFYLF